MRATFVLWFEKRATLSSSVIILIARKQPIPYENGLSFDLWCFN